MRLPLLLLCFSFLTPLHAQWEAGMLDRGIDTMHYLVHFPAGYDRDTADWPVILFLHGGGNSGSDLQRVRESGLPAQIDRGLDLPAIVLAPQNRFVSGFWDHVALIQLLDKFMAQHRVDADRQYLTGFSRGGFGAWATAMSNQGRFAALMPVCGAVPHSYSVWIPNDLPIWIHHGTDDQSILPSETIGLYERLIAKGMDPRPRLTMYPGVEHNAWDPAYANPEVYRWMLAQRRSHE